MTCRFKRILKCAFLSCQQSCFIASHQLVETATTFLSRIKVLSYSFECKTAVSQSDINEVSSRGKLDVSFLLSKNEQIFSYENQTSQYIQELVDLSLNALVTLYLLCCGEKGHILCSDSDCPTGSRIKL